MKKLLLIMAITAVVSCAKNVDEDTSPVPSYHVPVAPTYPVPQTANNNNQNNYQTPQKPVQNNTITPPQSSNDDLLLKKYSKEGFIDKNTFVVLIIKPANSTDSQADIKAMAQNRTLATLQKYVQSNGKTITPNVTASLLSLINQSGSLKTINDGSNQRIIYVYEISKNDLKYFIDSI